MADKAGCGKDSPAGWLRPFRHFLAFFTLLTLCSGAFIGMLFIDVNRQAFLWTRRDTVFFFASLAVLALAGSVVFETLNALTRQKVGRWGSHWIFLVFSVIAIQLIPPRVIHAFLPDDFFYAVLLGLGLGLSAWSAVHPHNKLKPTLWSLVKVLGVVPVLLLINLLTFPPLAGADDFPLSPRAGNPDKPPVLVFSFDSIAWVDCMNKAGEVDPRLSNIKAFQNESVDYSSAISPGKCTMISMPNLLYQRDPADHASPVWHDEFLKEDPLSYTNGLYFLAKQQGYRTSLIGIYLPYKQMLDPLMDFAYILPFESYTLSQRFFPKMRHYLLSVLKYLRGPFPERWAGILPHLRYTKQAHRRYYVDLNRRIQETAQQYFLDGLSHQDFIVVDIPIPHFPFVFLPDGTYGDNSTYATQLEYVDRVFGELMQDLRQSNIYDRTWVIFTSDHGQDSTRNVEKDHVPLIIKPPRGTAQARRIDSRIQMWNMGRFFQAVFQGRPAEECLAQLPGHEGIDAENGNE